MMLSKRLIYRTSLTCYRYHLPRQILGGGSYRRTYSLESSGSQSQKRNQKGTSNAKESNTNNTNGPKKVVDGNATLSIAERIKASFQRGGLLQRQSVENAFRNRSNPASVKEQNASGKGGSKPKVASNTVFNTGGGSQTKRAKPKAKKAPAQVAQQAPARPRVQRGKVQKTEPLPEVDLLSGGVSDVEDDANLEPVLDYERKQIHLEHKREKFARELPEEDPPIYKRSVVVETEEALNDPLLSVKSPKTVAEMKELAAQRLANKKENPVANTWVNYKELRRQERRARMNDMKEKNKIQKERKKGKKGTPTAGTIINEIKIPHNGLTVRELSQRLSMKMTETIQKLSDVGEIMDVNADGLENVVVDPDVIELLALDMNLSVTREAAVYRDASDYVKKSTRVRDDVVLTPRNPIISVMGHVDHGKTTLLDRLRHDNVAAGESGGITQKLSAFNVDMEGRTAVFLDTPGHAAFTGMRKSGASGADLVVLVVAIEDGVRPLTLEAAKVALKSGCTIFIALTKVDKITDKKDREDARRKALTGLMDVNIIAEDFGGDIQVVEVSGKTGEGVDDLVEKLLLQADIMELKASKDGGAEGVVLDAKIEKGRGIIADLLIKWGTLNVGDAIVVGNASGKVKALLDDKGQRIKSAGPSSPVRLLGLNTIPAAGQDIIGVENENKAKKIASRRQRLEDARRLREMNRRAKAIEDEQDPVVVPVILKADTLGGLDALKKITDDLSDRTNDVIIHIIRSSVGDVTPSDISLAKLGQDTPPAVILGFNINSPNNAIRKSAKQYDVDISIDTVIYRLEDVLEDVMKSHMPVERINTLEGYANVLQLFSYKMPSGKYRKIAGVDVLSGAMRDTSKHFFRVMRGDDVILLESSGAQLKRFKDTVHEVKAGLECGVSLDNFDDIQVGDRIECYSFENIQKELVVHSNKKISYAPIKKQEKDDDDDNDNDPDDFD